MCRCFFTWTSLFTFQHLINVVFIILYPPVITKLSAQHLLRDSIFSHINHWVSILSLQREQINMRLNNKLFGVFLGYNVPRTSQVQPKCHKAYIIYFKLP